MNGSRKDAVSSAKCRRMAAELAEAIWLAREVLQPSGMDAIEATSWWSGVMTGRCLAHSPSSSCAMRAAVPLNRFVSDPSRLDCLV